jgi:hypothetical protein
MCSILNNSLVKLIQFLPWLKPRVFLEKSDEIVAHLNLFHGEDQCHITIPPDFDFGYGTLGESQSKGEEEEENNESEKA